MITPYSKNAKKHPKKQIEQIAASIKEFGFNQPIVVDKDGVIIVGHGRYEAAKLLAMDDKDIPVVTVDLNEEQAKAYRLADNKLNESDWDMSLVIEELKGLTEPYLELTGFDKDLILEPDERDDVVPPVPNEPQSKLGDLYELGEHRVLCGDSTKLEDVERLMDGKKADMVFTDPPYNVEYQGGGGHKRGGILNDDMSEEDFSEFIHLAVGNLINNTNGALYICMGDSQIHTLFSSFKGNGGAFKSWIIWEKNHFVLGGKDYHSQSELILHGAPDEYDTSDGEFIMYGWNKHEWYGGRKQGNVWHFDKPNRSVEHPTMKPVMLCAKAITNSSKPRGLVLDTFLGSGSTLIAAEKTGRTCYGMELDPKYVDVIVKRWEDYTGSKAIKHGS